MLQAVDALNSLLHESRRVGCNEVPFFGEAVFHEGYDPGVRSIAEPGELLQRLPCPGDADH